MCHAPSGIDVDVLVAELVLEEEIVARATTYKVAKVSVPLATPEDLVILKAIAGRPQDLLDIDALLAAFPSLDRTRIRHWVKAFADVVDDRDIGGDLETRLSTQRARANKK